MGFFGLTGPFLRSAFRKNLGLYSYKIGNKHAHKETGMVPLQMKNFIKKTIKNQFKGKMLIAKMTRDSPRNFGSFGPRGFTMDKKKIPLIDIPDLKDFELKPYVTPHIMRPDVKTKLPSTD
jgi:hypothetical protein